LSPNNVATTISIASNGSGRTVSSSAMDGERRVARIDQPVVLGCGGTPNASMHDVSVCFARGHAFVILHMPRP
jgi:hypothetical protein